MHHELGTQMELHLQTMTPSAQMLGEFILIKIIESMFLADSMGAFIFGFLMVKTQQ